MRFYVGSNKKNRGIHTLMLEQAMNVKKFAYEGEARPRSR